MIRALMVDVDGVLVRGRPSDGAHWASTIEADLGVRQADLQRHFFEPYWDNIVVGRSSLPECLAVALRKIAPHLSHADVTDYWFANDARLDESLLELLDQQRAKGVKIFLATNQDHQRAAYLINQLGLGQHCDGICYSAALGCRKPDRNFFDKASAMSQIDGDELLLIDDTLANVAAAKGAGWQAFHWIPGSSLLEELERLVTSEKA